MSNYNNDLLREQEREIAELRQQLHDIALNWQVAQQQLAEYAKDVLRLIETIKYLRGIAVRGLGHEQPEDQTVEQFVLGYVKGIEQQLAEAQVFEALWTGACVVAKNDPVQAIYGLREQVKMLRDALEYYAQGGENEWVAVNALEATEPKP